MVRRNQAGHYLSYSLPFPRVSIMEIKDDGEVRERASEMYFNKLIELFNMPGLKLEKYRFVSKPDVSKTSSSPV